MTANIPIQAAAARYEDGTASGPLAREYGVTPATLRRKLVKAGVTMRPVGGRRKLSAAAESQVVALARAGDKQDYLAALFQVSRRTICRILRRSK